MANYWNYSVSVFSCCVHVYHQYHAALVDIRQCTATNVIKPKVVKETLQWRSEWLAQVQSFVNQTELTSVLKHTSHKSYPCIPQSSPNPNFIIIHMYALGMQTVLYELEM